MSYTAAPKPRLVVIVKAGRNLKLTDRTRATSDPYCKVGFFVPEFQSKSKVKGWISQQLRSQPKLYFLHTTSVCSRTLQPTWGGPTNTFVFEPPPTKECVAMGMRVEVWSKSSMGKDDFMGQVIVTPEKYSQTHELWYPLEGRGGKGGAVTGEILLSVKAENLYVPGVSDARPASAGLPEAAGADYPEAGHRSAPPPPSGGASFTSSLPTWLVGGQAEQPVAGQEMQPMDGQPQQQQQSMFSGFSFGQQEPGEEPEFDPYAHQPLKVRLRRKFRELDISKKISISFAGVALGSLTLGFLLTFIPFIGWAWTILLFVFAIVFGLASAFAWLFKDVYKSMIPAEKRGQLNVVLLGD